MVLPLEIFTPCIGQRAGDGCSFIEPSGVYLTDLCES